MSPKKQAYALLILAHNEAKIITETVQQIQKSLSPEDRLFVVPDHCTDDTAQLAQEAGAQAFQRSEGMSNSKGAALMWFVKKEHSRLAQFDKLVILDADTSIDRDFVKNIKDNLSENLLLAQTFVSPVFSEESPIAKLAALSELHGQYISDNIRSFLGWSVRLRGTGMVIAPELLIQLPTDSLNTQVEDIALTLLFASQRIKITRIETVRVWDPKPSNTMDASRQRARWFRGQWLSLWQYRQEIVKILLQGPRGWFLLSSLYLKPKWLVLLLSLLFYFLTTHIGWLANSFLVFFLLSASYMLLGFFIIPERKLFFSTIVHLPTYIWMWLHGIYLSFRASTWLRSRK